MEREEIQPERLNVHGGMDWEEIARPSHINVARSWRDHYIAPMADTPTREEINAKLEAVEARVDGKLAEIRADVKSLIVTVSDLRTDTKSTRTTVVVTGVASVLAVLALVIGLWQAGIGAQANMLSAFQAGLTALSTTNQPKP